MSNKVANSELGLLRSRAAKAERQNTLMRSIIESLIDLRIQCADGKPAVHAWIAPEMRPRILEALGL